MTKTEYLYDCSPTLFAEMPYREAIRLKRNLARLMRWALEDDIASAIKRGATHDEIFPLRAQLHAVTKAEKHNEELLDELEGIQQ